MTKIISWLAQAGFVSSGMLTTEQAQEFSSLSDSFLSVVLTFAILSLAIVLPVLLRSFHVKLQASKHKTNLALLDTIADRAVYSAEQTILHGDNITKYDYAAKILVQIAASYNITNVTPELCRLLIESSVYDLRENQKYISISSAQSTAS